MTLFDHSRVSGGKRKPRTPGYDPHAFDAIEQAYGEGVAMDAVRAHRWYEDNGNIQDATSARLPLPERGDATGRWLAENDPDKLPEGVEDQVVEALAAAGLTIEEAFGAFAGARGRPSKNRVALRERVAAALMPVWTAGARADMIALALGIPDDQLGFLMRKARNSAQLCLVGGITSRTDPPPEASRLARMNPHERIAHFRAIERGRSS